LKSASEGKRGVSLIAGRKWWKVGLQGPPTYLQEQCDLGADDYRRKQTKKAGLSLALPFPFSSYILIYFLKKFFLLVDGRANIRFHSPPKLCPQVLS